MSGADVVVEVDRLLRRDPRLGVPVPAFSGRSIPNVTTTALRAAGSSVDLGALLPPLAADLDPFGGSRAEGTVIVGIVDGLGWGPTFVPGARSPPGVPEAWLRARPITSVFPTTTTVALTSLSSAAPPGRTGVVGHREYLPHFGTVVELLHMAPIGSRHRESLVGPDWTPSMVSGVPTVFRRGVAAAAVTRATYQGTGFTRMLYDGAEMALYETAGDLVRVLRRLLDRPTPPPVVFLYWDELDTVEHLHGPDVEMAEFELAQVARILASVRRGIAPERARRATLLLTADHGQVTVARESFVRIHAEPSILALLSRPPTGDRRAVFFSARPGAVERLEEALRTRFSPGARILRSSDAIEGGLFGPPPFHPELAERIGDWIVILPAPEGATYLVPGAAVPTEHRPGGHGGLDPAELIVPLITGRLADVD